MKNKIVYLILLVISMSMISSAKKTNGCNESGCCLIKQESTEEKINKESMPEPASLSLFFFNI